MPARYDTMRLDGTRAETTPEGYLRQRDVVISRVGVFEYRRQDGTVSRELRPPEEVHRADSLSGFAGRPVTLGHPGKLVDAKTAGSLSVGSIGDVVKADGDLVVASSLTIHRADAVDAARGGANQLSCGYVVDLDPTPGVWRGQRYDAVQRNIRGNHVALVTQGRAGDVAALRLDADDAVQALGEDNTGARPADGGPVMAQIRIDGASYEVPDAVAPVISGLVGKLETAEAARKTAEADRDKAAARADEAEAKAKAMPDIDKLVAERIAELDRVREAARKAAPDVKLDGLDTDAIRKAVIAAKHPTLDLAGKSPEYIGARFDAIVDGVTVSQAKVEDLRIDAIGAQGKPAEKGFDLAAINNRNAQAISSLRGTTAAGRKGA